MLIDDHFNPRLADFGLCALQNAITTSLGVHSNPRGSLRFMAPELLQTKGESVRISFASDIYAFACTCIEVCPYYFPPIVKA